MVDYYYNNNITNDDIDGLKGNLLNYNNKNFKRCEYCDKNVNKKFYIKNINYCALCWGWLNINTFDLETSVYSGDIPFNEIKELIKLVVPIFNRLEEKEKNKESIFYKILEKEKNNTLHIDILKIYKNFEKNITYENKVSYISYKNRNNDKILEIDYEKSEILI
jgi:hypothetical protein